MNAGTVPLPARCPELVRCKLDVDTLDGRGTLNGPRENRRQGLLALEVWIELGEGLGLHEAILVEKPPLCLDSEESQHDAFEDEKEACPSEVLMMRGCLVSVSCKENEKPP